MPDVSVLPAGTMPIMEPLCVGFVRARVKVASADLDAGRMINELTRVFYAWYRSSALLRSLRSRVYRLYPLQGSFVAPRDPFVAWLWLPGLAGYMGLSGAWFLLILRVLWLAW